MTLTCNVPVNWIIQGLKLDREVGGDGRLVGMETFHVSLYDFFIKSIKSSPKPEESPAFLAANIASKPPRFFAFALFLLLDFASGAEEAGLGLVLD